MTQPGIPKPPPIPEYHLRDEFNSPTHFSQSVT
jgi:hypothetical protein